MDDGAGTVIAALIGTLGIAGTLYFSRQKDRSESARQQRSLQACVVADIRAILRVIEVAGIIENCTARWFDADKVLPLATGPRKEDYFVLYSAIAKDLGQLDEEVARRASAFYLLLKGSRDIAQSFDLVQSTGPIPADVRRQLIRDASQSVLEMLEHVYRNGFLAIALARLREDQGKTCLDQADPFLAQVFGTWMALVALRCVMARKSPGQFSVDDLETQLFSEFKTAPRVAEALADAGIGLEGRDSGAQPATIRPTPIDGRGNSLNIGLSPRYLENTFALWARRIARRFGESSFCGIADSKPVEQNDPAISGLVLPVAVFFNE